MGTKIRLKGFGASMRLGVVLSLLAAGSLQADVIWQNTNLLGKSNYNDSNTNVPSNTSQWTVFDNFTTPTTSGASWVVNSFDFTDYLINAPGGSSNVSKTVWSIWSGDPLNSTGTLVASGTGIPLGNENIVANTIPGSKFNGTYTFTISGLNVVLAAGTKYYLGTTNSIGQDPLAGPGGYTSSYRASASAPGLPGQTASWEQSNGSLNTGTKNFDSATASNFFTVPDGTYSVFDVQGVLTPEPGTWVLMGIAMAGFFLIRRRRVA